MQSVVILAVAAVWAAVIIPPLLRSRVENRPNSSVTDFRRQLSTLQRAVPTRTMVPMRGMARPLTQAPSARPAVPRGHAGTLHRAAAAPARRNDGRPAPRAHEGRDTRRQVHMHRVSRREMVRRRRANVLFLLVLATGISGFLAATTKADPVIYAFALSFVSLCGYCYKLAQLRSLEGDRTYGDQAWFHAA